MDCSTHHTSLIPLAVASKEPRHHRSRRRCLFLKSIRGKHFPAAGRLGLGHGTFDRCRLQKRGYRGVLAESWQMKGTRLQFKLRKGVRFHDGTPFTSKDVIASFRRILTDKQSLQAPNLQNIGEMEAPDDHTVVLTLKKPDANALEDINSRVIMKQSAAEKMGEADNRPIGTGPFKFTSWKRSGQFVIRRNESYWGPIPKIEEV